MKRRKNLLKKFFWPSAATLSVFLGFVFFTIFYFLRDLPPVERIATRHITQSTKIYDRTGQNLLYEISKGQRRTVVPLGEIPYFVKDATIVIEDENFYREPGVSWRAILRAFLTNLVRGRIVQGGSTITQQLAKNAFLSPEQTLGRKIKELILAVKLTRHYSKDEILEFYLNEIPYGPTAYGIEAASQLYFRKPIKDVTLAEAAILAALPRAPSYYSPWGSHRDELLNRQRYILKKMRASQKIDEEQLEAAVETEVVFAPQSQGIVAPHFVIAVQDYLDQKYGEDLVRTGGLKVMTTLDRDLQTLAEKVLSEGAGENQRLYEGYNAALVAQDPKTGEILALVGSKNYFATSSEPLGCTPGENCKFEPHFNVATQGLRQPGSALKPFVYLTAFQKGYTPETVVFDVPTEFVPENPACPPTPIFSENNKDDDDECFHPRNFDERFRGPVSFRQALAQSVNVPSVKVLYLAGLSDTLKTVSTFGITTLRDPHRYGLSLVLGGGEVKLVELVGAYSVLAQGGVRTKNTMILEIRDSHGRILESSKKEGEPVFDPRFVHWVNDILSDVEARSGLFHGSLSLTTFPDYEVALKTGTSNDYRDAWALGYTPSLVLGVWAGNNDNTPMQRRGSSILAAIPIWNKFMAEALKKFPAETFVRPEPLSPLKPILRGEYVAGNQIHSILYYVDTKDPTGPPPSRPEGNPQFSNWETTVLQWAKENLPDFEKNYNQPQNQFVSDGVTPGLPRVEILEPKSGVFIGDRIQIVADLGAPAGLAKIRVYFNNTAVYEVQGDSRAQARLEWSFVPPDPKPQNLLTVEVTDTSNRIRRAEVILFK